MPRKKSSATKVLVQEVKEPTQGDVARLTANLLEHAGDTFKQNLVASRNDLNLNEKQLKQICNIADNVVGTSKEAGFRQVISLYK